MDHDINEQLLKLARDPAFLAMLYEYREGPYDRRSHWDRREEFDNWSKGVVETIKATKSDMAELKSDVKTLTSTVADLKTDVALLGKDRDTARDHWEEMCKRWQSIQERWIEMQNILSDIRQHGCDVYAQHSKEYIANARADERLKVAQENLEEAKRFGVGRTWPDIISSLTPSEIVMGGVIALLLFYIFGGVDKILTFIGLG